MKKITLILGAFLFVFSSVEAHIQVIRRGNSDSVEQFNNQQYQLKKTLFSHRGL